MVLIDTFRRTLEITNIEFAYRLWRAILEVLHERLAHIESEVPNTPSEEEKAVFQEVISYLDSLAHRKASGDKTTQKEIEAFSYLLSLK